MIPRGTIFLCTKYTENVPTLNSKLNEIFPNDQILEFEKHSHIMFLECVHIKDYNNILQKTNLPYKKRREFIMYNILILK